MSINTITPHVSVRDAIVESSQIKDAKKATANLTADQLRSSINFVLAQPPETSWINKPTEVALFISFFKKTGYVDGRILERFFYTLHDIDFLFDLLEGSGFGVQHRGDKYETALPGEPTVFFLSTKFGDFASSQEYFFSVLELISKSVVVVLLSERGFSARYEGKFRCIKFNGVWELNNVLKQHPCGLMVDLTGNHSKVLTELPSGFRVVDPHGVPRLDAEYLDSQLATASLSKYRRFLINPVDSSIDPLMFVPPESVIRSYPNIRTNESMPRKIIFGAFCRTAKLSLRVVMEWARVLRRYGSSELWFAFIQSNPVSEAFVKRVFERLGVSQDRIRFIPRLDANRYLELLNHVTINLGAMPEQGGISCMDSLLMGCPYVTCRALSNTFTASLSLQELGLAQWDAGSSEDFHNAIDQLLEDPKKLVDAGERGMLRARLMASGLGSGDRTALEWVRFFRGQYAP